MLSQNRKNCRCRKSSSHSSISSVQPNKSQQKNSQSKINFEQANAITLRTGFQYLASEALRVFSSKNQLAVSTGQNSECTICQKTVVAVSPRTIKINKTASGNSNPTIEIAETSERSGEENNKPSVVIEIKKTDRAVKEISEQFQEKKNEEIKIIEVTDKNGVNDEIQNHYKSEVFLNAIDNISVNSVAPNENKEEQSNFQPSPESKTEIKEEQVLNILHDLKKPIDNLKGEAEQNITNCKISEMTETIIKSGLKFIEKETILAVIDAGINTVAEKNLGNVNSDCENVIEKESISLIGSIEKSMLSPFEKCISFVKFEVSVVKKLEQIIVDVSEMVRDIGDFAIWESNLSSFAALLFWLTLCYTFDVWMIPAFILLIFIKQFIVIHFNLKPSPAEQTSVAPVPDETDVPLLGMIHKLLGIVETGESIIIRVDAVLQTIKLSLNYRRPTISCAFILASLFSTIVLLFIPFRYLLMFAATGFYLKRVLNNMEAF